MRAVFLILSIVFAAPLLAQGLDEPYDVLAWDTSRITGFDKENVYHLYVDPKTGDSAFVQYKAFPGFVSVLDTIYIKSKGGDCFLGNRTISAGRSKLIYRAILCNQFEALGKSYFTMAEALKKQREAENLDGN